MRGSRGLRHRCRHDRASRVGRAGVDLGHRRFQLTRHPGSEFGARTGAVCLPCTNHERSVVSSQTGITCLRCVRCRGSVPRGMRSTDGGTRRTMRLGFGLRYSPGVTISRGQETGESEPQSPLVLVFDARKIEAGRRVRLRTVRHLDWRSWGGGLDCTRWLGGFDLTGFTRHGSGFRIRRARRLKRCGRCLAPQRCRRRDQRLGVGEQRHHQQQHRHETSMAHSAGRWSGLISIDASIATSNHHWTVSECGKLSCDPSRPDASGVRHERQ